MFTDIEDSTSLLASMGDDGWSKVLRWHDATLRNLFARFGGQEIKQRGGGDGFFVAFKSAAAAIDCAIAIQAAMTQDSPDSHVSLRVRIGVHEAEAIRTVDDYSGRGVHEAARIAALACGGEILASVHTLTSAGTHHQASLPRTVDLRGLVDPVTVASVRTGTAPPA
jgi:class 3 adenylate cyclase